jgi:hypothetical protein
MIMAHKFYFFIFLFFSLLNPGYVFSQTIKVETPLFDMPDGKPSKNILKEGVEVKVLNRKGFWVQIESTNGFKGWVKVGVIKFSDSKIGSVSIDTGRATTGNIVATSASRGLSVAELEKAKPNYQDIDLIDAFLPKSENIVAFTKDGDLIRLDSINELTAKNNNKVEKKSDTRSDDVGNKGDVDEW